MYQGNWKCSKCGGTITELPFQPRSEAGLTCKACFIQSKNSASAPASEHDPAADSINVPAPNLGDAPEVSGVPDFDPFAGGGAGEDNMPEAPAPELNEQLPEESRPQKPKFEGDWKCSVCGAAITSLPFTPRSTEGLKCIDCFKAGT